MKERRRSEVPTADAEHALAQGNPLQAYTLAREATAAGAEDPHHRYLEVLSLARMGDIVQAKQLYQAFELQGVGTADALSLRARLLKDEALELLEPSVAILREAAAAYEQAYEITGDPFPLINAASLFAAAGDRGRATSLAHETLNKLQLESGGYWVWATKAEALLVLGRDDEARQAVRHALDQPDASLGARSSTIRQFEHLIPLARAEAPLPEDVLELLRPPPVLHFCGHIFSDGRAQEAQLASAVERFLDQSATQVAFGALAAGADILIAEHVLKAGAELNIVLPFPIEDFVKLSVEPAGVTWMARFQWCCSRASSLTLASNMPYVGDPRQISYGANVAMGTTVLRAEHLSARAIQLAIWDGQKTRYPAGTFVDISSWSEGDRETKVIPFAISRHQSTSNTDAISRTEGVNRGEYAILFADFSGFSKIGEGSLPLFWQEVMGTIAKVVHSFQDFVLCKNTWGDALYLILEDVTCAAELALSLQEEMQVLDLSALGVSRSGMRIALHYGTMYCASDPVTDKPNYFGSEVSKAARLEPVTPTNSVYVTQPFAAVLALKQGGDFDLHYVGEIALAKDYGKQDVYRLQRCAKQRKG